MCQPANTTAGKRQDGFFKRPEGTAPSPATNTGFLQLPLDQELHLSPACSATAPPAGCWLQEGSGLSDGRLPCSRSAPTGRCGCPAGARRASAEQTLQQARAELTLTTETETQDHCHERREAKRQVQQVTELRGETGDVRHSKLKTLAVGTLRSSRFLQCSLGAMLCHPCCW